jgi:HD-GYP domain-containing protein (c-di-GMP phosphodiesterase class II)
VQEEHPGGGESQVPGERHTAMSVLQQLTEVALALSTEKDHGRLMQLILGRARALGDADGGTLYTRTDDDRLRFEIVMNESLGIHQGGSSEQPVALPEVPLYDEQGEPNRHMVAAWAAVSGETVNIPDAYDEAGFDFSGTREFDARMGYRSRSFLTVPMRNHRDEVIGVLQLINKQHGGRTVAFDAEDLQLVQSLASLAAISVTNQRLIEQQAQLFESFIELMAAAIDDKSPYTGGHCRRVPELTMMLADAAAAARYGPLADFSMSDDDRYELRIAGWLHDCGKVTTPEHIMDKAVKLETIHDRMHEVRARFEILKRDGHVDLLECCVAGELSAAEVTVRHAGLCSELDEECEFLARCNVGGEFMREEDKQRVHAIAARRYVAADGVERALLSEDEVTNLTIEKGTLTRDERKVINHHITATIQMLESLPYPKHLRRVPEFAGGHHEHMDGSGYPRGLNREQMSVQARVMGIADVFEALTAADRPYKKPMTLSQALTILGRMCEDRWVDADLFEIFVREKVYLRYAETFLEPSQIDVVDETRIPGLARVAGAAR